MHPRTVGSHSSQVVLKIKMLELTHFSYNKDTSGNLSHKPNGRWHRFTEMTTTNFVICVDGLWLILMMLQDVRSRMDTGNTHHKIIVHGECITRYIYTRHVLCTSFIL